MGVSRSDSEFSRSKLSIAYLLDFGVVYTFDVKFNLANGASNVISLTTGPSPVLVNNASIQVSGTRDLLVEYFAGGTVTSGVEITEVFPRNHFNPRTSPYLASSVFTGRTVSVAGTKFLEITIGQQDRGASDASGGFTILAPNTLYYITITNNEQTADVVFEQTASTIE